MRRHIRPLRFSLIVALAACCAACLVKDTASTVCIETDGTVTWSISESAVRSESDDGEEASREESDYLEQHASGWGPLAAALSHIGAEDVRSVVLRDRPPFDVRVTGAFASLDGLVAGYCASAGWSCASRTLSRGDLTTWTWTVTEVPNVESHPAAALDEAVGALRIALAEGRFVASEGFELIGPRLAAFAPSGEKQGKPLTVSLAWRTPDRHGR